ncbi:MAG: hypothetical protein DLM55_08640 [Acidimicrobiales bacterium]|nr:MAG: hypothetical protein DLM55_08640 [Acidimicrobiales bacterium]
MHGLISRRNEHGAATVEFVFLGVLILVPLFYVTIAIFSVQSDVMGTMQAAREAGRAFATAPDVPTGVARAQYAMRLTLHDYGVHGNATLRFLSSGSSCSSAGPATSDRGPASLDPGARFTICVVSEINIPGVPTFFEGASKTITARYEVQVDKLRVKND